MGEPKEIERRPITVYGCTKIKDGYQVSFNGEVFGSVTTKDWKEKVGTLEFKKRLEKEAADFLGERFIISIPIE